MSLNCYGFFTFPTFFYIFFIWIYQRILLNSFSFECAFFHARRFFLFPIFCSLGLSLDIDSCSVDFCLCKSCVTRFYGEWNSTSVCIRSKAPKTGSRNYQYSHEEKEQRKRDRQKKGRGRDFLDQECASLAKRFSSLWLLAFVVRRWEKNRFDNDWTELNDE